MPYIGRNGCFFASWHSFAFVAKGQSGFPWRFRVLEYSNDRIQRPHVR